MFWSIISSFVQNKNATVWRVILFGEQSSRAARSFYNHRSSPLLLGPAGSTLHLPWEDRVSNRLLHPKQKHKQVENTVQLVRNLQDGKRSRKNKWWDKGANKIVEGEVEHVMLHDITSEFTLELPVQSGPNLRGPSTLTLPCNHRHQLFGLNIWWTQLKSAARELE